MVAAIYVRLSEEDRDKQDSQKDSESIANQRSMLVEYAAERGWDVYGIYSDDDYSGSDATRPDFNRMINDARDRKFKIVLCKSLSRFARDVAMVETYINGLFIDWGIRFISVADYADSGQKGSRKNIQINSLVNQWYLEDLSENIKTVMTHKKKQGQFVGSYAPYGYLKDPDDNHKLIIDEDAAPTVKRIFKMYLDGYGYNAIANQLNDENIPCPSKHRLLKGLKNNRKKTENVEDFRWSDHTIWNIMRNPNYTGDLTQCRYGKPTYKSKSNKEKPPEEWIVVKNTHEPIISRDDYNRVQTMKQSRGAYSRSKIRSSPAPARHNAFAGLIKCKLCGHSLVLSTSGESNKFTRYFRCTARKSKLMDCKCAMVKYDVLEEIVTEKIRGIINQYCDFDTVEAKTSKKEAAYQSEIARLQKSVEKALQDRQKIERALGEAYIDKTSGVISADEFSMISRSLAIKKDETAASQASLTARIAELQSKQNRENQTTYIVDKYKDFTELTREIAGVFIENIFIGERVKETEEERTDGEKTDGRLAKRDFYLEIIWRI